MAGDHLLRLSPDGELKWAVNLGGSGIKVLPDGTAVLTSSYNDNVLVSRFNVDEVPNYSGWDGWNKVSLEVHESNTVVKTSSAEVHETNAEVHDTNAEVRTGWSTSNNGSNQTLCFIVTDKSEYLLGENIIIKVTPTPAFGVKYVMRVYLPNGTLLKETSLHPGVDEYELNAGPVPGQYTIELWSRIVYPNSSFGLCASTQYRVLQNRTHKIKLIGTVQWIDACNPITSIWHVGDWGINVTQIVLDPANISSMLMKTHQLIIHLDEDKYNPLIYIDNVEPGDVVEVYGTIIISEGLYVELEDREIT